MHKLDYGVHFNLPDSIYHMCDGLSSTGIRKLHKSPLTYWSASPLNPDYNPEPKKLADARRLGRIFHMALFEPERFEKEYYIAGGAGWELGKNIVTQSEARDINMAVAAIRGNKRINRMLTGGISEMSIIFPFCGVKFRARMDYTNLIPGAIQMPEVWLIDYKTVKNTEMMDLRWSIPRFGYDVQAMVYVSAVLWLCKQIRKQGAEKMVKSGPCTKEELDFLDRMGKATDIHWINLFQEKVKPYVFKPKRLTQPIYESKLPYIAQAVEIYKYNLEVYGTEQWPSGADDNIEDVFLEDLPTGV